MTDDVRAQALIDFWFGDASSAPAAARERNKIWFQATASFDDVLRSRYGDLPSRLQAGEFTNWGSTPRTGLARILAFDQIPRNIFRGTPAAFAFDALARRAALEFIERGEDQALHPIEAVFVYLPFEHAEDEALQRRSVDLFRALLARAPADLSDLFESYLDYAERHRKVIVEFGRFPHRNATIGRPATPAEIAYLEGGGQRF